VLGLSLAHPRKRNVGTTREKATAQTQRYGFSCQGRNRRDEFRASTIAFILW